MPAAKCREGGKLRNDFQLQLCQAGPGGLPWSCPSAWPVSTFRCAADRSGRELLVCQLEQAPGTQLYLANSDTLTFLFLREAFPSSRRPHNLPQPMCLHGKVHPPGGMLLEAIICLCNTHSSFAVVQVLVVTCTTTHQH